MAWSRKNNPNAEEWGKTGNHSVINYSATVSTQSYMRQTETISGYRLASVATDDNPLRLFGPARIRLIEGYGSPKKDNEFSHEERLKGSPWNSAAYNNHSPFPGEDDHDVSTDDDSDDEITCVNGVCYRGKKGPNKDGNYNWNGESGGPNWPKPVRAKPEYDSDYAMESPKPIGGNPYFQRHNSPVSMSPKKGPYDENPSNRPVWPSSPRGKPDTDRLQSPKASRKPIFTPVCTSPKKDAYPEKPNNKPIGSNSHWSKPDTDRPQSPKASWKPIFTPVSTSPKKDAYPGKPNNKPTGPNSHWSKPDTDSDYDVESPKSIGKPKYAPANGKHPNYSAPANNNLNAQSPLIRNKPEYDTGYPSDSPKARRNPQHTFPANNSNYVTPYEGKPVHRPTIDSQEASKRYGKQGVIKPTPEETYGGTIDCKEAARKYKGVLVP